MGLSISYDRVMSISTDAANSVCSRFEKDGVVCPPKLRKNLFTTGALDNIDHNPSATTAKDSFHGTAISLVQHPTSENCGNVRNVKVIDESIVKQRSVQELPEYYTSVKPVVLNNNDPVIPKVIRPVMPPGNDNGSLPSGFYIKINLPIFSFLCTKLCANNVNFAKTTTTLCKNNVNFGQRTTTTLYE